ncbi:tetratricopeptide repeat protein [Sphingobium rhizovicinum]|uniref:Tetratricopeptide repeat protein n=1 Tax=Sphingobium rhizovicinum TaxID=432308 RepID=A0ABV7NJW7_9SPHN
MKHLSVLLAATSLIAVQANAADKPVLAPAPTWVIPAGALPEAKKEAEAPVELLRSDQQVKLEKGRQTVYTDVAMRIGTPQGLAAGNISFPWRPETDDLTVHKLTIRRGDQLIDVLASQSFTVMRREQNLENATLDGVLTANIQPEGLQVGDIVEFAASISSSDPTFQGHVEQVAAGWNGMPIGQARLRMQWPTSLPARLQASRDMPAVKPVRKGDMMSVDYAPGAVEPIIPAKGAPARYAMGRYVELSDFSSWADLGALLAPLYDKAAALPAQGALKDELDRIAALSPDPKKRAQAALTLVQDRIRYVALAMGTGGLVPADADTTWSRRYGDCKGKTALLLGLLHALGIAADAVAVNSLSGDGIDQRLPMVGLFNHVLVRATIGGKTYWLDGTRTGDTDLDRLQVPAYGWGLPLTPKGAALVRMMPAPLDIPDEAVTIRIDATAGLSIPAPITVETVLTGDGAIGTKNALANLTGAAREDALRRYWKGQYDFVEVQSTGATFDPATGQERLTMQGLAKMDWDDGWYETDKMRVGYKADFSRDPGPDQKAPFAVAYPYYSRASETILLPPGFSGKAGADNADVDETVAGIAYKRSAKLEGNVFHVERSERSLIPEFPAADAPAAQAALRRLADKVVYLRKPAGYRPTGKELAAMNAATPDSAKAYFDRGRARMDSGQFKEAVTDFTKASELDPKDEWALANRGMSQVWLGDYAAANKDMDAVALLNPKNPMVFRARGLIAERKGQWAEAVAAYSQSLALNESDSFTLGHRAIAQRAVGNNDAALADAAAALKLDPRWTELHLLRATILRGKGDGEGGVKEGQALEEALPDDGYAHVAAASIYDSFGRWDLAQKAYDRAIAIKPEPYIYINRGQRRPRTDLAGKKADFAEALRLSRDNLDALVAMASLQRDNGDTNGAIQSYSRVIAIAPGYAEALVGRGLAYDRAGNRMAADKDFVSARTSAGGQPQMLNNLCWMKATMPGVSSIVLQTALVDCDAALKPRQDFAPYLDSRGLVLLRLARLDDAIADYDKALGDQGTNPTSLYGRALAWAAKGDRTKAEADRAAAIRLNGKIVEEFAGYGLPWPADAAPR